MTEDSFELVLGKKCCNTDNGSNFKDEKYWQISAFHYDGFYDEE